MSILSSMPSISSITSCFPVIASPRQILRNASGLAITAIALCALSNLSLASAGPCEDRRTLCVRTCMALGGVDPNTNSAYGVSACLIGCDLGYMACLAMGR
ncbi:MAG: hypothetical protein WBD50_07410 [Candidatus Rhabdochlamydia sp.]